MTEEPPAGPTVTGPPYDPAVALTRVQAAGPELLKACKVALAAMCKHCPDIDGSCSYLFNADCKPVETLRAAIKEAEGKAP